MIIIIFFFAHWYLSLFSQSFFHHRYAAHGMFTMNRFWQKFFHVFAFITQGSSYLSAYAYGALHRMHHAYTDTDKDPHSPRYDDTAYSMMMRTRKFYNDIDLGRIEVEERFTKGLPTWRGFDKIASSRISRVLWSFAYIGFYLLFATHWWMYILLPIHFLMSPVHGVIVNWVGHKVGRVRYKQHNDSKNIVPVDVLMMGESYHNNHHQFPNRPNFGVKWYEIDVIYPFIILFDKINIIKLTKEMA